MAPVESGGVGWFPSSAADTPGLFSPLNSEAAAGVLVDGVAAVDAGDAAAAWSFAFRSAAGFMVRRGCGSALDDLWAWAGISSAAWTWPTGATTPPEARETVATLEGAAPAMTGARKVTPKTTTTDASRRIAIVRRTRPPPGEMICTEPRRRPPIMAYRYCPRPPVSRSSGQPRDPLAFSLVNTAPYSPSVTSLDQSVMPS